MCPRFVDRTTITVDSRVQDYTQRAVVKMSQSGPTLTIAAAGSSDAGRYKCSLTVGNNTQVLVQTVHIRGETSTDKLLVVSQGDEMTLSCNISEEGDTPTVSWSKQVRVRMTEGVVHQSISQSVSHVANKAVQTVLLVCKTILLCKHTTDRITQEKYI